MLTPWPITFDPFAENPWHVHTSTEHVTSQCIVTRDSCKLRLRRFLCSEKLATKETKKILLFIEMIHNLQHHHVFRETLLIIRSRVKLWSCWFLLTALYTVCMFTRKHRHLNKMGLDTTYKAQLHHKEHPGAMQAACNASQINNYFWPSTLHVSILSRRV